MARPRKEINWEIVQKRMEARNSAASIAEMHNIDINTFYDRFKDHFGMGFADYSDRLHTCGKENIAFTQYMKALAGNTNMLTLLGREWLGQGKEQVQASPYEDLLSLKHENMMLKAELANAKDKLNAN